MSESNDALTAAQKAKIRRAAAPVEPSPADEAGELNVVPFLDIVSNVMMFVLAGLAIGFVATLEVKAPHKSRLAPGDGLGLTVILGGDGYYVKGAGGSIASGCDGIGTGTTVPRIAGAASEDGFVYDAAGLTRCARKLKDEVAQSQKQVLLSANPNVPMQEVVRAMDALRRDDRGELFPDVVLTVVK